MEHFLEMGQIIWPKIMLDMVGACHERDFWVKIEAFHYYCSGMNLKYETQGFKSHPHSLQLATVQLQLNSLVLDERIVSRFNTP